jgi:elongation factor Ts
VAGTDDIKRLREETGAGIMDCKKALEESAGNIDKAKLWLREKGLASAAKKTGREANQGLVESYIHAGGRVGAIVEVNCETDFVARTDDFRALAREIAMQVAAMNPSRISAEDAVPEGALDETPLLKQAYIRDGSKSIQDLITDGIAKLGENIVVRRFTRFELGSK